MSELRVDPNDADGKNLFKYQKTQRRTDLNIEETFLPDSVYLHRSDFGDLTAAFKGILQKVLSNRLGILPSDNSETVHLKIKQKIEIDKTKLTTPIITDVVVKNLDDIDAENVKTIELNQDSASIERASNIALRSFITPYKGYERSKSKVLRGLKAVFKPAGLDETDIHKLIACSEKNQQFLSTIFEDAIQKYQEEHIKKNSEIRRIDRYPEWRVPEQDEYTENYDEIPDVKKSALVPYFRRNDASQVEKNFEKSLDNSEKVVWWYKNGEKMQKYFGIEYQGVDSLSRYGADFYPDYIVKFVDGTVGIFETKGGWTADPTDEDHGKNVDLKANALQNYLREHAEKRLWGGIVIPHPKVEGAWQLQGDAITHEMAVNNRYNDSPQVKYLMGNWQDLNLR
jgi:type III restriction enzyme